MISGRICITFIGSSVETGLIIIDVVGESSDYSKISTISIPIQSMYLSILPIFDSRINCNGGSKMKSLNFSSLLSGNLHLNAWWIGNEVSSEFIKGTCFITMFSFFSFEIKLVIRLCIKSQVQSCHLPSYFINWKSQCESNVKDRFSDHKRNQNIGYTDLLFYQIEDGWEFHIVYSYKTSL